MSAWLPSDAPGLEVHAFMKRLGRLDPAGPWMFLYSRHARTRPGVCAVIRCRHRVRPSARDRACTRCKMARWRLNFPAKAAFSQIRDRARRKGIAFLLTWPEFRGFCESCGYIANRGRSPSQWHLDREDPTRGYELDNIRILTGSANSAKGAADKKAHWLARRRGEWEECPF